MIFLIDPLGELRHAQNGAISAYSLSDDESIGRRIWREGWLYIDAIADRLLIALSPSLVNLETLTAAYYQLKALERPQHVVLYLGKGGRKIYPDLATAMSQIDLATERARIKSAFVFRSRCLRPDELAAPTARLAGRYLAAWQDHSRKWSAELFGKMDKEKSIVFRVENDNLIATHWGEARNTGGSEWVRSAPGRPLASHPVLPLVVRTMNILSAVQAGDHPLIDALEFVMHRPGQGLVRRDSLSLCLPWTQAGEKFISTVMFQEKSEVIG